MTNGGMFVEIIPVLVYHCKFTMMDWISNEFLRTCTNFNISCRLYSNNCSILSIVETLN